MDDCEDSRSPLEKSCDRAQELSDSEVSQFEGELRSLLNRHCRENGSDTPAFILASYMRHCLDAWDVHVAWRDKWYGRSGLFENLTRAR